ncbi:hypothetical protein AOL_s00110g218 [Orbilia oligospora ATCC 24927]|uniref:Uncharacterized protein n=1 Tax=Arthrobotrys oligospora (strain ATCC 24927 / CBS 115.81 / DSM 1491) TaxID=756982 RepID=G1XL48_ARTOA|nr:hypothetical protein AOL_s00110g218 [Orbilia oligospora ATCC 24927]EGX46054.1 hypothetical protein AOL_s00110g218 [Orbilia oligospora ATCC 24927]
MPNTPTPTQERLQNSHPRQPPKHPNPPIPRPPIPKIALRIPPPDPIIRPHHSILNKKHNKHTNEPPQQIPLQFQDFTLTFFQIGKNKSPIRITITKILKMVPVEGRAVWECILPDGDVAVIKYWAKTYLKAFEAFKKTLYTYYLFPTGAPFLPSLHNYGEITHPIPPGYAIILEKRPGKLLSLRNPHSKSSLLNIERHLKLFFGMLKDKGFKHTMVYYDNLLWDEKSDMVTVMGWTGLDRLWKGEEVDKKGVERGYDKELFLKMWTGKMMFVEKPVDVMGTGFVGVVVKEDGKKKKMWLPR